MVRKMRCKWISYILSMCMIFTLMPSFIVSAQEGAVNVNGSELEMWIGDTQVCAADISVSVSADDVRNLYGNQLYKIYSGAEADAEYDVYASISGEGKAEQLYIQPTCTDGTLDIPGIRILGSGDVCLLSSVAEDVAKSENISRQITVNLNAYTGTGNAWDGYAVYSEFSSDGRPSDKVKFLFDDGALHTDEATGDVTGSTVNVNGTIKATSLSSTDVVAINFGSEEQPLDYALEFVYGQSYDNDWDIDSYYEIEILKAKVNAYINNSFVKDGSYKSGPDTVSNCYKSLLIYNDADLTVTDASADNDSEKILGNIETMRVMTGGSINIVGEEDTAKEIKVPKNVRSSYYSSLGTYRTIEQNGERIQNFVETVDCVVDSAAEGYNADTNPTPHKDTEGRYSYTRSNNQVSLVSTSRSLSIIGIAQNIENGHFEVESGCGIMNEKGDLWAEEGTPVTFTLVPDAGYQYKPGTFCSNGWPVGDNNILFKKTDDPGVYIYTMGPNACSITCEFEKANDEMDVQSENVGDASIDMGENDLSGTMEFEVSDATNISDDVKTDIEDKAGEYEVGSILDLTLDQKINTITGEDAWETNITELEHDMSISLSLDKSLADGEDYEIIRVHDGKTDVVEASYDQETDTLTFNTDRFSTYAIAYKKTSPEIVSAKNVSLSRTSYTYDGKVKKPTVTVKDSKGKTIAASNYKVTYGKGRKNVGKYTVKVTFTGDYAGTVTKTFKINPKSTTISSITAKSKGFKVKWKKNTTQTTGYQIQYSTNSKFKGAKTVTVSKNKTTYKTISKLKAKKKYYVRIRTYKKIGSTKYYSSWSKTKTVKTKR